MTYAELHARTYFSFLDGGSSPRELIERALALNLSALAITDVAGVYGIVEAREALLEVCQLPRKGEGRAPLKLIYGSEVPFADDVAVVLARSREGYANLCSLLATGRLAVEKGEFRLDAETLYSKADELILMAGGPHSVVMKLLCGGNVKEAERRLARQREAFGERCHVELVRHRAPGERERSVVMAELARRLRIPIVATNEVYFHAPERKRLHDVLRCIQHGRLLREAGRLLLPNAQACLKSSAEMAELFSDLPEALERTKAIADDIRFQLCEVTYRPPTPDLPPGETPDSQLARLSAIGLRERLGAKAPRYESRLKMELDLIAELGYAGYFLVMWDIVIACRARGILCQGRGSAANSLVCYVLGITSVGPEVTGMLFERFLSRERAEPPDIDLDIEHERREEIIQYVYEKYGRERAGMVAEVIRYRQRSATNEVGKVLGFPPESLARLSKFLSHGWKDDEQTLAATGIDRANPMVQLFFECAHALVEFPRHLSIHVGGFILSEEPLDRSVPIENGRMPNRTVIQWAKDDVDAMGMFKLDLLGLGMLTVLSKAFVLVRQHRGRELTLPTIPEDDPPTYAMLQKADSVGVFQVESRAQMSMLPRLKPKEFYDLVIEVAIVRPGPIQGQMVHPYLRRKEGREAQDYPHPRLKEVLGRTLGVPLFQEQVMQIATIVAGYTPGEADQLRRDMASWRSSGKIERHRERLITNMLANGIAEEFAKRIYEQLQGFAAYGFPESHAAAFAYLAYASAYLKRHYPAEFACALINSQPMGFYSPAVIVNDAKRHGVEVRPIDVRFSDWDCAIEQGALRLGFRMVRGLGEEAGEAIVKARRAGPFLSVRDLAHRAGLQERQLIALAAADALRGLQPERRKAVWAAMEQSLGPLFEGISTRDEPPALPSLRPIEQLRLDITYGNAFPFAHPMEVIRPMLDRRGILPASALAHAELGRQVRVAGLVITRQKPAAKGFVFVTLEDETGHADVAVSPGAFARFEDTIRLSSALIIRGKLVGSGDARNIAAAHVAPLAIEDLPAVPSHDFH